MGVFVFIFFFGVFSKVGVFFAALGFSEIVGFRFFLAFTLRIFRRGSRWRSWVFVFGSSVFRVFWFL